MKQITLFFLFAITLAACSSSEPEYADKEAHEKTEQLRKQYTPLIVGTWHIEQITENHRFFERLTFQADGKMNGIRKWQIRQLVTVEGVQRYTDWENVEYQNGEFFGTWRLQWERDDKGIGQNIIYLYAQYENPQYEYLTYSHNVPFNFAGDNILRFKGFEFCNKDGWTEYQKGDSEPSF